VAESPSEALVRQNLEAIREAYQAVGTGDFQALLDLATRVKRGEVLGGLERKILAAAFMDPSLRTRASLEAAMFLHGGLMHIVRPDCGREEVLCWHCCRGTGGCWSSAA